MDDLISRQAAMEEISKQQTYKMFEGEDTLYLDANDVGSVLASLPSAQPEPCDDCISRQAAIEAHYEYCNKHPDAGFPVWSLKILEDLPSAQPERTCVNCGRTANNGGWYADGRTRCPIEEHYALPKDGYCHLWEKRNVTDDDYPERREE